LDIIIASLFSPPQVKALMKKHSIALLGLGLLTLVLVAAAVVASQMPAYALPSETATLAKNVDADTAQALDRVFENIDYAWPPAGQQSVPPLLLNKLPADFGDMLSAEKRRKLFLRALLPIVLIENQRLHEQRELATWLLDNKLPAKGSHMRDWLAKVAKRFRVRGDLSKPAVRKKLLIRLDEIPPALALAQAAIETGWGSSRFALEGNSLFGQWTFVKADGLTPEDRDTDATHLVASFPNLRASVRAYMQNLNTSNAYHEFRTFRAAARAADKPLRAYDLASHLHRYSAHGENYIAEIQSIIRSPAIAALTKATLSRGQQTLVAKSRKTHSDG
jgi:Bax protein